MQTENEYLTGVLSDHQNQESIEEKTTCKFCGEESEHIIMVTDMDGDRWPMCRECLNSEEIEAVCVKCGGGGFTLKLQDGMMHCEDCGFLAEENEFWSVPFTVNKTAKKAAKRMKAIKLENDAKAKIQSLIRAEFDRFGDTTQQWQKEDQAELIAIAEKVRISYMPLDPEFINELKADL